MTPHFNASFRIYDPPQSHLKPCSKLHRQLGGRTACRPYTSPLLAFLFGGGSPRLHHRSLLWKAQCLCFPPSTVINVLQVINVLGALAPSSRFQAPRGKGPNRRYWSTRPRPTTVLSRQCNSELCQLPDIGRPHCSVANPSSRPASAQARFQDEASELGQGGLHAAASCGKAGTCGGLMLLGN